MIPSDSSIRTQEGLLPVKLAGEEVVLWTGSKWADATISAADKVEDIVDIHFKDGSRLLIPAATKICLAGPEEYLWKRAGELSYDDNVCISLPDGRRIFNNNPKVLSYWTGYMFSAGRGRSTKIEFDFKKDSGADFLQATERFKTTLNRQGNKVTATCSGPRFQSFLGDLGAWFDDAGRMAHVPPGCRLKPGKARRLFCRGAIEGAGNPLTPDRLWRVDLETKDRARGLHEMCNSVGIPCELDENNVYVRKWIASYELKMPTPYPEKSEILSGGNVPYEVIDEFLGFVEECGRTRYKAGGIFRLLNSFLKEDPNAPIHPVALRAAWRQLGSPAPPIFNTVKPVSVIHRYNMSMPSKKIVVHDIEHSVAINNYVVLV